MPKTLKFCVAIPTYNGAAWIKQTLQSILAQSFQNFEILICDDGSTDETLKIIRSFRSKKIKIIANKINVGYGKNLQRIKKFATGEVLFLMGQDDILLPGALQKTHDAFFVDKNIGLVVRPYYWFMKDFKKPVRRAGVSLFEAAGQLSGLACLRKYLTTDFQTDTFVAHVYPLANIARDHKVIFLEDDTVAVRIESSQTRFKASIYDPSPVASWVKMFNVVFPEEKFKEVRRLGIEHITTHFVGLAQIKNYGTTKQLFREIYYLAKLNPKNLLRINYWIFSLGAIIIPRRLLIRAVDFFKPKL